MLSRIAGDEFICLLKNCALNEAIELGEQAQDRVSSFRLEVRPEQYASVGLSVGAAGFRIDGESIDELLNAASLVTRQNKARVGSRIVLGPTVPLYSQNGKSGPLSLVR